MNDQCRMTNVADQTVETSSNAVTVYIARSKKYTLQEMNNKWRMTNDAGQTVETS